MLIEFKFSNYRSFRDEACLSMEATGLRAKKRSLISFKPADLLPAAAIFGKTAAEKATLFALFGWERSLSATLSEHSTRTPLFQSNPFC